MNTSQEACIFAAMTDFSKVANIVKRVREYRSSPASVPKLDEVKGAPSSSENKDETYVGDPVAHNTPSDIGPENDQTISGTGKGPVM